MREIPGGLRTTFLINFIQALVFGLAGTFAARLVGDIASHPVHDFDVNFGLGATTLGLAVASWFAYRATRWESISILTLAGAIIGIVGGVGSLLIYFAPTLFGIQSLPFVSLIVAILNSALGIAFAYFYLQINGLRAPAQ